MKTVAQVLKSKDQKTRRSIPSNTTTPCLKHWSDVGENVGALPVIKEGVVVGIISERDYARKLILKGLSSVTTRVDEVMSSPVITVDSHKKVDECMNIMTDSHLRHLPVVEDGKLLGLLSIGDLVKEAIADQADLIKQLEQYIRGE